MFFSCSGVAPWTAAARMWRRLEPDGRISGEFVGDAQEERIADSHAAENRFVLQIRGQQRNTPAIEPMRRSGNPTN
jgi:hypothetical protein